MKPLLFTFLILAPSFSSCVQAEPVKSQPQAMPFTIDAKFPGGNVKVDKIEGDTIRFSPDLRDTSRPWFYWYFRVKGAGGRTLSFETDKKNMGVRGPGVSLDAGKTWTWLGRDKIKDGNFSYAFPKGADDVRFSVGMPYVRADFDAFIEKHKASPFLKVETLTQSNKGRDVVMARVSEPGKKAPYLVVITGRHHACEMMASYTLEGLLEGALSDDATGKAIREKAEFVFVPFADTDGVEDGDQGKNRSPHDHNRDYGPDSLYAEVKALKQQIPIWSDGRPLLAIDMHDPALKTDIHEVLHLLEPKEADYAARMGRFSDLLERDQQSPIVYSSNGIVHFGTGYNKSYDAPTNNSAWIRTLPDTMLSFTMEIPYANASGYEVNAYSARELGRDLATAINDFLGEKPENIMAKPEVAK